MPFKLMPCHFEKKQDGYLKENKMCLCLFLPISGYNALHSDFSLSFFFLLFVNFDVPFHKKNDKKFQDGRHWEQNAPKVSILTI